MELRNRKVVGPQHAGDEASVMSDASGLLDEPMNHEKGAEVKSASSYSLIRRIAAWLVHLYTGLGVIVNFYSVSAIWRSEFREFCILNWLAIFIDASDGTLARLVDVKKVVPSFDGAGPDNIIDFITFSFLPALCVNRFELVPRGPWLHVISLGPLLASSYQFCQKVAKTEESFVGFPSYWNLVLFYTFYLKPREDIVISIYVLCTVLSFVPFHFVYPTRTKTWRKLTLFLGAVWAAMMILPIFAPGLGHGRTLVEASLFYPLYYVGLSIHVHLRLTRSLRQK